VKQEHYFQSQRSADARDLGSSHTRTPDRTANTRRTGIAAKPSHEEVAKRAYLIYRKQGCPDGRDVEHWLAAEAQMMAA